jgi:hypothetical protein
MDAATLRKAVVDYTPSLNVDGRALAQVLAQCDGSATPGLLRSRCATISGVITRPPRRTFVQRIIKRYA